ncbi:prolyl oligopeptidase family serine peptidase [Salibacterium aidingense]|uniref:prolyl oligopeptidase family serine peptidase n=1 Tax=Salibacterium aidingense TaxID=384933 RepID=UPI003BEDE19D
MLAIAEESFGGVPALHIYDMNDGKKPLPAVLYWHGFSSAKEHNLHIAYQLAKQGVRVIMPEAKHHGERHEGLTEKQRFFQFWSIVLQSLHEIEYIYDSLEEKRLIKEGRIFAAGTSMGGILACGALAAFPWIKGGAVMMGTPAWEAYARRQVEALKQQGDLPFSEEEIEQEVQQLLSYDLSRQPELLAGRPLFFWHGREDQVIDYRDSFSFYEGIKKEREEDVYVFHLEQRAGHKVTREGMLAMTKWTAAHI